MATDMHPALLLAQVLYHVGAQVVADGVGVPAGGVQEALCPLWSHFADLLRELPAVLALDVGE